jgi:hypothetical protein
LGIVLKGLRIIGAHDGNPAQEPGDYAWWTHHYLTDLFSLICSAAISTFPISLPTVIILKLQYKPMSCCAVIEH